MNSNEINIVKKCSMLDWLVCWHNPHQIKGIGNGRQDVQHCCLIFGRVLKKEVIK